MRVTQSFEFLGDAVADAVAGRLLPAAFQRPYVWGPSDVEALFASMLARYPVGSITLWRPHEATDGLAKRRIGPVVAEPAAAAALVLDGQNRLGTFAWAVGGVGGRQVHDAGPPLSSAERKTWLSGRTLVADAAERTVRFVPEAEAVTAWRVPLGALFAPERDRREALYGAMDLGAGDAAFSWWDEAALCVRTARVVVTTLSEATTKEAVAAFSAINRPGVPITDDDLSAALAFVD